MKTGITAQQASNITANNAKVGITTAQAAAIAANTAKTGITSDQAAAITANTLKTGITAQQASDIIANNAKVSYPGDQDLSSYATTSALASKAPLASPTFTGTVSGITSAMVGLGSVDNTSDADKPISDLTQSALDLKAPLASPAFTGTPALPTGTTGVTQSASDNSTKLATTAYADAAAGAAVTGKQNTLTNSAGLSGALADETGTGLAVFATSPTLVTPNLGTPSAAVLTNATGTATALNIGGNAATATLASTVTTNANLTGEVTSAGNVTTLSNASVIGKVLTGYTAGAGTVAASDNILQAIQKIDGNGAAANTAVSGKQNTLTNSAGLSGALNDETGTGLAVFATSPTLVTPNLGTPSALVGTNISGTAANLTAGRVTTNANLTGEVTSVGNATTLSNAAVIGKVLSGYTAGAGTVAASDNILEAIEKIDGNFADLTSIIFSLQPGYIFVGSLNGTGTEAVLLQGDATVGTNGVVITNNAINSSKILDGTILNADISASAAISQSKIDGLSTSLAAKANLASPTFTGTVSGINKSMVGLGSVDNTSDADKPISTLTQAALDLKAPLASPTFTGTPLAPTATLGTNTTQIATTAFVTDAVTTATPDATTLVKGKVQLAGDLTGTAALPTIANDAITTVKILNANVTNAKIATGIDAAKLADGSVSNTELQYINSLTSNAQTQITANATSASTNATNIANIAADAVNITTEITALETLANGKIYLGNGSNVATEVTISGDVTINNAGVTTIGASKVVSSMIANGTIVDADISSSAAIAQSKISGLSTSLEAKANLASPTFTGTVSGINKSMVGLGSVDNTSDAGKPISTATQTALNSKAPLASPTFTGTIASGAISATGTVSATAFVGDGSRLTELPAPSVDAGTLTGSSLNSTVTGSSLTSVGTLESATVGGKVIVGATSEATPTAILEVSSTTQGFLPPRMTIAQRSAITNPAQGLMIYCTNCGTYGEPQYYNGNAWMNFAGSEGSKNTPIINLNVDTYTFTANTPQGPTVATNTGTGTTYVYTYEGTGSTSYSASSTRPTNAGTYSVTVSLNASGDGNYTTATASAAFTIAQAMPTVTLSIGTYAYSGTAQGPNTATNTGTGSTYAYTYEGTGSTSYAASSTRPTNAGTYSVTVSLSASGDGNYTTATASAAFTIAQAIPTVTPTIGTYAYSGTAQGPSEATNTGTGSTYTFSYSGTGSTSYGPSVTRPTNGGTYTVIATVAANGNYTIASSSATAFRILAVGDPYGGGIIAYILVSGNPGYDANTPHGLIAATSDHSVTVRWLASGQPQTVTGATGFTLGTGLSNTNKIISSQGTTTTYAARVCADYSITVDGITYSDWYLPSIDELRILYRNKTAIGGFRNSSYWSSTERNDAYAYERNLGNDTGSDANKSTNSKYVRAIRAF
uniref:hypothetical protein n=1 Tax=Algoriphagus sp. TaxID=1872435 RepID=UPI0040478540